MTDQKKLETISEEDLDTVQGAGIAVGNPGKKKDIIWADASAGGYVKPEDEKKLFGDDLGIL